jgi:hypothetical protein
LNGECFITNAGLVPFVGIMAAAAHLALLTFFWLHPAPSSTVPAATSANSPVQAAAFTPIEQFYA